RALERVDVETPRTLEPFGTRPPATDQEDRLDAREIDSRERAGELAVEGDDTRGAVAELMLEECPLQLRVHGDEDTADLVGGEQQRQERRSVQQEREQAIARTEPERHEGVGEARAATVELREGDRGAVLEAHKLALAIALRLAPGELDEGPAFGRKAQHPLTPSRAGGLARP